MTSPVYVKFPSHDRAGKGNEHKFKDYEILHIRGLSCGGGLNEGDGLVGLNPIEAQRESIALSAAALDYGARFFQNDAQPRGVLEMEGAFKDREKAKAFVKDWQSAQAGVNRHKTAILEGGMKYTQIGLNNRDSQFLETRKYQVEDIARMFRIPPHMLQHLERSTNNNIEHQGLEFVVHTMMPWLLRWEQAISRDLVIAPDLYFPKFNVDALLRGDTKNRYEAHKKGIESGFLTRNEARIKEGLNPLPGLDEPVLMLNMSKGGEPDDKSDTENDTDKPEGQAIQLNSDAQKAEGLVRKQVVAITERLAKNETAEFEGWLTGYYDNL